MDINTNNKQAVEQALKSIEVGAPVYHAGLTVFPLTFDQTARVIHLTLEEALASNLVEITETSESGNVPELLLINRSDSNILLLDGEELVGAKQNRTINITILVAARMKIKIPVSCVERGRWSYRSKHFSAGAHATTSMRSKTTMETMDNIRENCGFMSDQNRVWDDVDCFISDLNLHSESSAMHDGYESISERTDDYELNLRLPDNASGYIACIGGRVLGGDLFVSSDVMVKKWPQLLRGVAVEALRAKEKKIVADVYGVQAFLSNAIASIAEPYSPPGTGTGVHIDGAGVIGNALLVDGAVVHISMFARV